MIIAPKVDDIIELDSFYVNASIMVTGERSDRLSP